MKGLKGLKIIVVLAGILGLILPQASLAQEEEKEVIKLGQIVVTATKTERGIEDVPASVEVVTKDDIKKLNVKTTQDAVKSLCGVSTKGSKGIAELYPSISIRGMKSGKGVSILVDGKEVPAYQWPRVPVESIERIEVVKGASSSLYGNNAMGGIVNIITKKPEEGITAIPKIGYETNNTKIYELFLSGKKNRLGFTFNLQRRDTDGYVSQIKTKTAKEVATSTATKVTGAQKTYDKYGKTKYEFGNPGDNWFRDENYGLNLSFDITDTQNLTLGLTYSEYEYGYEDAQTLLRKDGKPYYGTVDGETVQFEEGGKIYEFKVKNRDFWASFGGNPSKSIRLDYDYRITDDFRLKSYLNYINSESWYNDPYGKTSESPENKYQFELQTDIGFDLGIEQVLTSGIFYEKSDKESEKWYLADWRSRESKTGLERLSTGDVEKMAVFLQDELRLGDYVTLLPGVRYDRWEFSGDSKFRTSESKPFQYDKYDERNEDQISPKLSILFKPIEALSFRGSIGKGFNAPDIGALVNTWAYGSKLYIANPNLEPERNTYYEVGADFKLFDRIQIKGTYFNNQLEDMIYYNDYTDDEITAYNTLHGTSYRAINIKDNLGEGELAGYEAEVRVDIIEGLSTFANYTYTKSEVKEHKTNLEIVGNKIPNVPEDKASFGIDYVLENLTATVRGNYTGDCFTTDSNTDKKDDVYGGYDSYTTWDAKISYKFPEFNNLLVSFTVDNILDEEYYEYYINAGRIIGCQMEMEF